MRVAVLGLGEAGSIYATDLAERGVVVSGTDPHGWRSTPGVTIAPDIAHAVDGAELVISLVGAQASASVLDDALAAMNPASTFVDMNTAGPEAKRALAATAAARGTAFVDAAILAPVPRARVQTPLLLSGSGNAVVLPVFAGLGIPVTDAGAEAGVAASMKLLRSVFMKGLAGVVLESVTAAEAVGAREWVLDQIASELGESGHELVHHLLEGTILHAVRRETEMRDVRAFLQSLDAAHPMTDGTIEWLHAIAQRPSAPGR